MIYAIIATILIIIIQGYLLYKLYKENRNLMEQNQKKDENIERNKSKYEFMLEWVTIQKYCYSLADFLGKYGYNRVAIYGMGEIAYLIYDALKDSDVEVVYFIDNNADNLYHSLPIFKLKDELPYTDLVLIAIFGNVEWVSRELKNKVENVLSIIDVVKAVGLNRSN